MRCYSDAVCRGKTSDVASRRSVVEEIFYGLRKWGGLYLIFRVSKISCSVLDATKTPWV